MRWPKFIRDFKQREIEHNALIATYADLEKRFRELERQHGILVQASNLDFKRLRYYEQHIPRMRDLRRRFELEGMGIRKQTLDAFPASRNTDEPPIS